MWGIVPAAGVGSRIQPLAFSKELLPVGSRLEGDAERPRGSLATSISSTCGPSSSSSSRGASRSATTTSADARA